MQFQSNIADAEDASGDIFRELSKTARLAGEALDASAALLGRAQALVRGRIEQSCRDTASLALVLRRLEAGAVPGETPVSVDELLAATAAARQLMLRSADTVLGVRALIGSQTMAECYRWSGRPSGPTMTELHQRLDQLLDWVAEAAACSPVAGDEIRAVERGLLTMRNVARCHRSVADDAMLTAEKLQAQATRFVRLMEQVAAS
jgi:hypothetical protein